MKKYLKLLTIIVVAFVMMIGINVNAEDDYYLCSNGGTIMFEIPIHKIDSNKKALDGAQFTLKDFNNKISYKSEDVDDGDYLIEVYDSSQKKGTTSCGSVQLEKREGADLEFRVYDYTSEDEVLTEILDMLPTKYSDVYRNAQSEDDLYAMLDLPAISYADGNFYEAGFYVPLKVEETKVPAGYKAKNIVIPAFVEITFNNGNLSARISYSPGYYSYSPYEMIPAYFEYNEGTDYEAIFDKINKKLDVDNPADLIELFEDNGAIIDDECDIDIPRYEREDIEAKFDDDIEDYYCPITLVDEKEEVIIVNPETAGTIGIVTLLILISSAVVMYTRKVKNN